MEQSLDQPRPSRDLHPRAKAAQDGRALRDRPAAHAGRRSRRGAGPKPAHLLRPPAFLQGDLLLRAGPRDGPRPPAGSDHLHRPPVHPVPGDIPQRTQYLWLRKLSQDGRTVIVDHSGNTVWDTMSLLNNAANEKERDRRGGRMPSLTTPSPYGRRREISATTRHWPSTEPPATAAPDAARPRRNTSPPSQSASPSPPPSQTPPATPPTWRQQPPQPATATGRKPTR